MPVTIRVYATLIEKAKSRVNTITISGEETVGDLLRVTGLYDEVVEDGRVKAMYKILVNGRDIEFLNGLDTRLKEGDVVDVFPPVAGG